jgi:chemotaxis signal transduction protein
MVCFRTAAGHFALPVESTLAVRKIEGMVELPAPRDDIVGMLPGDPPLTVLSALGEGGDHVLIIESDGLRYGLQVLEVLGVTRFGDDEMGPSPRGQLNGLIVGTVATSGELVLVADAKALADRL